MFIPKHTRENKRREVIMSIELLKKLPTPTEIKADYPVTQKVARIKEERDEMIRKVFTGESDKFLVIIGPCSADNEEAVCEYINRLSRVQEEVADKLILIPNGSLSNSSITNYSHMDMRRIDLIVGVGYASDLSKVKAVLEGVVKTETAVIKDEPVDIFVSDLGDSAVDMGIRVWVKTEDYWPVRWRLLEQMKNALDENGISIPFPQMDVSIRKE